MTGIPAAPAALAFRTGRGGQLAGILLIALGLSTVPVSESEAGSSWPLLRWVLVGSIVPYVLIVAGLVLGGRNFQRQGQSGPSA